MNTHYLAIAIFSVICLLLLFIILVKKLSNAKKDLVRYAAITDLEKEVLRIEKESEKKSALIKNEASKVLENAKKEASFIVEAAEKNASELLMNAHQSADKVYVMRNDANKQAEDLRDQYRKNKKIYDDLIKKIELYREEVDLIDIGFYQPHFDFDTSERYKENIIKIREKQKLMLKDKSLSGAIHCHREWTVGDSKVEGRKMINRAITIALRAFNGECDAAIANTTFSNADKMEERINKSFEAINKNNIVLEITINQKYLSAKIEELHAVYEWKQKRQEEKEEQRALREQIRDEERAQREIDKAIKEAEEEEKRAQRALDKARTELQDKFNSASEAQKEKYRLKINELQIALAEAESKGERALSMAQQTKRGHVYIISNIGSFGEDVFKIGLTRRLDPQDRVDELGSASVPFLFDVHAMINSDDAPALENALHQHFDNKRTNAVNRRKEFFNVTLNDIKEAVYKIAGPDIDFVTTATAQHYRETQAMRAREMNAVKPNKTVKVIHPEFSEYL